MTPAELDTARDRLAARCVVTTIETEGRQVTMPDGTMWWDTAPLLDPGDLGADFAAMNAEELRYALATGIAQEHPVLPHLVRIDPRRICAC